MDDLVEDASDDSVDAGVMRGVAWKDRIVAEQKDVLVWQRSFGQSQQQVLTRMRSQKSHLSHTHTYTVLLALNNTSALEDI